MADIQRIDLTLATGTGSGTSTNGDVYLGIGGREFSLDTTGEDFDPKPENGKPVLKYTFGSGANVRFPEFNDPRDPQLKSENISDQPVYIRFAPQGRDDNWNLLYAWVTLNGNAFPTWGSSTVDQLSDGRGIWLGTHAGLMLYLVRHASPIIQVHEIEEILAGATHAS